MALPDSGNPADYSPAEIAELIAADKTQLTKNQKAALARYNFQKAKEAQAQAPAAPPAAAGPAKPAAPAAPKEDPVEKRRREEEAKTAKAREEALEFPYAADLARRFPSLVEDLVLQKDKPYLVVKPGGVVEVLAAAKAAGFVHLQCLTACDWPPDRIEVVYNLFNYETREFLAAKARVARTSPTVQSVSGLWPGAVWLEREVYDMFGVRFDGLSDHRRLLLPDGWTGFPLLKDYDSTREQYIALSDEGEDLVSFEEAKGW